MYPNRTVQKTDNMTSKHAHQHANQRPQSTSTTTKCRRCSLELPTPPPSPSTYRHSSSSTTTRRIRHPPQVSPVQTTRDVKADLNNMIDEHIAWTQGTPVRARRTSQETMIVDWDGTGAPVVSWRERQAFDDDVDHCYEEGEGKGKGMLDLASYQEKPLPAPPPTGSLRCDSIVSQARSPKTQTQMTRTSSPFIPTQQQGQQQPFTALYHPPRYSPTTQTHHPPYIAGYDAASKFSYDYDGRVVHVHRHRDMSSTRLSAHSDYYAMDLEKYGRGVEVRLAEDEVMTTRSKKTSSVGKFVKKVLYKLEGMGVLGRLREDRKAAGAKGKGKLSNA